MCVSAPVSFGVGLALLPAGAYCLRKAVRKNWSYFPLALVPLLFGVQQLAEGFVWIGLDREWPALVQIASLVFLYFALSFWPVWLPFSVLLLETRNTAKIIIAVMAILGLAWTGLLYLPILQNPEQWLTTTVACHSVRYAYFRLPLFQVLSLETARICYGLPMFLALMVSGDTRVRVFGLLLTASAVVSELVFWYAFASVWCFFAALLALYLCFVFAKLPDVTDRPSGETLGTTPALLVHHHG